ncbi:MAG: hypothetical protein ACOC8F_04250 [Planctomycetota bacterium]
MNTDDIKYLQVALSGVFAVTGEGIALSVKPLSYPRLSEFIPAALSQNTAELSL